MTSMLGMSMMKMSVVMMMLSEMEKMTKATSMLGTSVMKVSAMMMMMMMDNGDGEVDEGHLNAWYVSESSSHEGALDRLLHYVSSSGVSSSVWS